MTCDSWASPWRRWPWFWKWILEAIWYSYPDVFSFRIIWVQRRDPDMASDLARITVNISGSETQLSIKCCALSLSCVQLFATPLIIACHTSLSKGILWVRILEWISTPTSRESSQPKDWTQVSHIADRFFITWAAREAQISRRMEISQYFNRWLDVLIRTDDPGYTLFFWKVHDHVCLLSYFLVCFNTLLWKYGNFLKCNVWIWIKSRLWEVRGINTVFGAEV